MGKRAKCLSLFEKSKIIEESHKGASVTSLAKKYGVAKSTVCAIKNKESSIIKAVANTFKPSRKKTLKKGELPRMEHALYKWLLKLRAKNIPISGEMLKQKAIKLHDTIKESNQSFNASDGWLQRFKSRFGIRLLKIAGEKLSCQSELVDPFKNQLASKIKDLQLNEHQIYNADETGLFWKLLPDKTFVSITEKTAPGLKVAKQRITFLACTNASAEHKFTPLVIGKAKNPRSFKNFNNPAIYKNSKNAWMTSEIFKNWFHHHFVPEVKCFLRERGFLEKAILILDNAPSHPPEKELRNEDGSIFAIFMPPNVTPLIQPMDQNVIRLTKLHYRTALLASLVQADDIGEALKRVSLKDAVENLMVAWAKLDSTIVKKCFRNILENNTIEDEDDLPLIQLRSKWLEEKIVRESIDITINLLQEIHPTVSYALKEIEEWNTDKLVESNEENDILQSDESDCEITEESLEKRVSHEEAVQSFDKVLDWAQQNAIDVQDIIVLKKLREKALITKLQSKKKQVKLTSYFSKK